MKSFRLPAVLTLLNLGMLTWLIAETRGRPAAPVLRGSALEITDDQGRVRASIKIEPAGVSKVDGKAYPETVIIRLSDAAGRPSVKIGASAEGSGAAFGGRTDETYIQILSEGDSSRIRLTRPKGEKVVRPE